jgi:hypothetical protein
LFLVIQERQVQIHAPQVCHRLVLEFRCDLLKPSVEQQPFERSLGYVEQVKVESIMVLKKEAPKFAIRQSLAVPGFWKKVHL